MFIAGFRQRTIWAIYPAVGVILGLYVLVSVILVAIFAGTPKAYAASLVIDTLFFLVVLCTLLVLNKKKEVEDG